MQSGYRDFEFDLPGALLSNLVQVLDIIQAATLAPSTISDIPEEQGIYQLFLNDRLVYIGKTDAEAGLKSRLQRHYKKLQHRIGLAPEQISFKAVRIYVFTAVDLEAQLIRHYGGSSAVPWQGSGFGANDPGQERDTTTYSPEHFDVQFPIDIDRPLDIDLSQCRTAAAVFARLKAVLPFVFRFEAAGPRSRRPHPELAEARISLPEEKNPTARKLIEAVLSHLPAGWQATKRPSHIIVYKRLRSYPQADVIAKSPGSETVT